MFWPKKVCFCDGKSLKTYCYVFGDVRECLFSLKPDQNGLGEAFEYSFIAEESHKQPYIRGLPKKNLSPSGWHPRPLPQNRAEGAVKCKAARPNEPSRGSAYLIGG